MGSPESARPAPDGPLIFLMQKFSSFIHPKIVISSHSVKLSFLLSGLKSFSQIIDSSLQIATKGSFLGWTSARKWIRIRECLEECRTKKYESRGGCVEVRGNW